jgi:acetyl-CoA carboxylase carboxyltransferase component
VADAGTLLELRRDFGTGVITALARIGGRAVALAASQPRHLGGALDAPACDKLARFMQLADAFGLPLVSFVDSPGFMVGPDRRRRPWCAMPRGCSSTRRRCACRWCRWCCAAATAWARWR